MSINCNLLAVSNEQISELVHNPMLFSSLATHQFEITETFLQLGKSFHLLHYILTGTDGISDVPLGFILSGGKEVENSDVGYGAARVFMPKYVVIIANRIISIQKKIFLRQMRQKRPPEMQFYGIAEIFSSDDEEYALFYFDLLKAFLKRTVDAGWGMIVYFN